MTQKEIEDMAKGAASQAQDHGSRKVKLAKSIYPVSRKLQREFMKRIVQERDKCSDVKTPEEVVEFDVSLTVVTACQMLAVIRHGVGKLEKLLDQEQEGEAFKQVDAQIDEIPSMVRNLSDAFMETIEPSKGQQR